MTVNKLREIAKSGGGAAAAAIAKDGKKKEEQAEARRASADDDSDDDEKEDAFEKMKAIFRYVLLLSKASNPMEDVPSFRLRVDLSALRPDKSVVQLNKVSGGRPVFCIPSIEGVGQPLATLAAKIPFPVYSVQATPAAPQDNIEQLALYYAQVWTSILFCTGP